MKEIHEFRIYKEYAHLLLKPGEGKDNGSKIVVFINRDDDKFEQVRILTKQIKEKYNNSFFLYSNIKREYSKKELATATLLQMKIRTTFEPAGEECGTLYDETAACEICGANRKQVGALKLKKSSIPKKDIARTIAGEVVVSQKFVTAFKQKKLKGALFEPIVFAKGTSDYYQLIASSPELELTDKTITGVDVFDFSEGSKGGEFTVSGGHHVKLEREIYKCPKGHTIGLNLLSEAYVLNSAVITESDFFVSKQKIGVKRGLLRPEPIYFCSQAFREMIEEEKLIGFEFEIANIK